MWFAKPDKQTCKNLFEIRVNNFWELESWLDELGMWPLFSTWSWWYWCWLFTCFFSRHMLFSMIATSRMWLLSDWNVSCLNWDLSIEYTPDCKDLYKEKNVTTFLLITCWNDILDILNKILFKLISPVSLYIFKNKFTRNLK